MFKMRVTQEKLDEIVDITKRGLYEDLGDYVFDEEEFREVKKQALQGDVRAMFKYGEQCYYKNMFAECAYWIRRAFRKNGNFGRPILNELALSSVKKILANFNVVKKEGFGFEEFTPIKVLFPASVKRYFSIIRHKYGEIVYYTREDFVRKIYYTIDKYSVYVITKAPNYKLLKYTFYFDIYSNVFEDKLVEDFVYDKKYICVKNL